MVGAHRFVRQLEGALDPALEQREVPAQTVVGVVEEPRLLVRHRQRDDDAAAGDAHPAALAHDR